MAINIFQRMRSFKHSKDNGNLSAKNIKGKGHQRNNTSNFSKSIKPSINTSKLSKQNLSKVKVVKVSFVTQRGSKFLLHWTVVLRCWRMEQSVLRLGSDSKEKLSFMEMNNYCIMCCELASSKILKTVFRSNS